MYNIHDANIIPFTIVLAKLSLANITNYILQPIHVIGTYSYPVAEYLVSLEIE